MPMLSEPVYIDFETYKIEPRPKYPPEPVGVAVKFPGKDAIYLAWGHPTGNNCNKSLAHATLVQAWAHPGGVCFHNAKFDLEVARVHFDLPIPHWSRIHDTMFMLFIDDPNQEELGLKPSARRHLGLAPDEQDAVGEYLMTKVVKVGGKKISTAKKSSMYFGGYIALAPGDLVGTYAVGDITRTERLFELLSCRVPSEPYDRERKLVPILLEMEARGIPTSPQLAEDLRRFAAVLGDVDESIADYLGHTVSLDSPQQLLSALLEAGKVDRAKLKQTTTGASSASKESLHLAITDTTLLNTLLYRRQLKTSINTFMGNWVKGDGRIYTSWNQVKGSEYGARTGRMSSTPNFQNIPTLHTVGGMIEEFPPLPDPRRYIVPLEGHALVDRDYSQQELRVLAHFENGLLMAAYQLDPWVDLHEEARTHLERQGKKYTRKQVKMTNLGIIYGMGVGKLADSTMLPLDKARELRDAILEIYPGLSDMMGEMRSRSAENKPVTTWGGRKFYCEPPRWVLGKHCTFEYKMLNTLIQGSSADATKEAIIRFDARKKPEWKMLLFVHDQITVSVPKEDVNEAHQVLKECMESIEFDVPLLTEGKTGLYNWSELTDYDKKGVIL